MEKAGRLMGRPLMMKGKRTKKIDARFTEDEYKLILEMEKQLGISKTDLVRSRVLDNAPNVVVNARDLLGLLDSIGAELGRSGNNINQLARYANILVKKNVVSPFVLERFNLLFETYLENQNRLETAFRQIIRTVRK